MFALLVTAHSPLFSWCACLACFAYYPPVSACLCLSCLAWLGRLGCVTCRSDVKETKSFSQTVAKSNVWTPLANRFNVPLTLLSVQCTVSHSRRNCSPFEFKYHSIRTTDVCYPRCVWWCCLCGRHWLTGHSRAPSLRTHSEPAWASEPGPGLGRAFPQQAADNAILCNRDIILFWNSFEMLIFYQYIISWKISRCHVLSSLWNVVTARTQVSWQRLYL